MDKRPFVELLYEKMRKKQDAISRHRSAGGFGNSRHPSESQPVMKIIDNPYDRPKQKRYKPRPTQYQSVTHLNPKKRSENPTQKTSKKTLNKPKTRPEASSLTNKSDIVLPAAIKSKYQPKEKENLQPKSKLQPKEKEKPPHLVNDIIVVGRHFLASMLSRDTHEESVFNIDTELEGKPAIVSIEAEPTSAMGRERTFERDYLLLDMRNSEDFEFCRIFDCR